MSPQNTHTSHHSVTTGNEKELLATEGTVIVHMTFAIKQDPELRKEFLKGLKVRISFNLPRYSEWSLLL